MTVLRTDDYQTSSQPARKAPIAGGLTAQQKRTIDLAERRRRVIFRAGGLAAFNGWSLIFFAALTILISHDPLSLTLTALFGFAGYRELRGRKLLRQLNPAGPALLGYNQILLAAIVVAYCGWCIASALLLPHPEISQASSLIVSKQDMSLLPAGYRQHIQFWQSHVSEIVAGIYGLVILVSLITQGLMAVYYFTRQSALRAYLEDTPEWVVDMQRAIKR